MPEIEDIDIASKSLLLILLRDVEDLKESLAGYRSMILRRNIKTENEPDKILKGLAEQDQNMMIQLSDLTRRSVERCQIEIEALAEANAMDKKATEPLKKSYETIISLFAPPLEVISKYSFEISKIFAKGTIEKTLSKMETFYEQYSKE